MTRAPSAARRFTAAAALICLELTGAAIVIGAAGGPSPTLVPVAQRQAGTPGWLAGLFGKLGVELSLTGFTVLFVAMCVCYLVVLSGARSLPVRWALVAVVVVQAIFFLGPPIGSGDAFGYIAYAREGATQGVNPYLEPLSALPPGDPILAWTDPAWNSGIGSVYGPLFTLGSYVVAPLSVPVAYWTVRVSMLAASLGLVALVWSTVRALGRDPLMPALVVGLNPLLLVFGLGGAHNDLVAVLLTIAGVRLAISGREGAGGVSLVAAAGVKASAGLVLPYFLAGARQRGMAFAGAAAGVVVAGVVSLAAFGLDGVRELGRSLRTQSEVVGINATVSSKVGQAIGYGGTTDGLRLIAIGLFVAVALVLLVRVWRGADWLTASGWAALALLMSLSYFQPWYYVWVVPLAAVSASRALRVATLVFGGFVVWTTLDLLALAGGA